jgi:glutathione S-transferase
VNGGLRILGDLNSGNCLKVLWVAQRLGLSYDWVDVDVTTDRSPTRSTRGSEFLALNPAGEVPVVVFPDGRALAQSNAIIRYLARSTTLLPDDAFAQAKIDEWLFWEQYSHEPYIAVCRFQMRFLGVAASEREVWRVERGERALERLEQALAPAPFLANGSLSIADIALLAYTPRGPRRRLPAHGTSGRPSLDRPLRRGAGTVSASPVSAGEIATDKRI